MFTDGYIKLHRSLLESPIIEDAELLQLWVFLLLSANFEDKKTLLNGEIDTLKNGQLVTGRKKLAGLLNSQESKIYRKLQVLEKLGSININANNKFSLITIENWGKYQGLEGAPRTTTEQQLNNNRTTTEQQMNTYIRKKERNKEKKKEDIYYCSELNTAPSRKKQSSAAAVFEIEVLKGEVFEVFEEDIEKWQSLYPAVDIVQQIRNMIGWLDSNPQRRKTKNGMPRFVNNWLSKEQNRGGQSFARAKEPAKDLSYLDGLEDGI